MCVGVHAPAYVCVSAMSRVTLWPSAAGREKRKSPGAVNAAQAEREGGEGGCKVERGRMSGKEKGGEIKPNKLQMQLKQHFVVLLPENNRFKTIFIIQ